MGQMQQNTVTKAEKPTSVSPADVLGALNDVEEKHAPQQLFYAGDRGLLERGPRVSVVGSRKGGRRCGWVVCFF
jgi:predicted Rossmann fold nucleotide-binding protein DprA/Smf involved in DNA uptake